MHWIRRFSTGVRAGCALALIAMAPLTTEAQTAPLAVNVNLPAQTLESSLAALEKAFSVRIARDSTTLASRPGPSISGSLTLRQALGRLLAGSGLEAIALPDGSLSLRERSRDASDGVASLTGVRVVGSSETVVAEEAQVGALGALSLVETPFSVNVVNRAIIDAQQSAYLNDYVKNDPSAVMSNVPVGFLTLRGFDVGYQGFLYDGLPGYLGLTDGRGLLEAVDRVEIMKGPSSFLNGIGATSSIGGTFNYMPKRAPAQQVRQLALTYTGRSVLGVHADVGDRMAGGKFGYRFNLAYKDGEQTTADYDWTHRVATASVDWRVSPKLFVAVNYDHARNELPRLYPFFVLSPGLNVPKPPDASKNVAQPWDNFQVNSDNVYARADLTLKNDWVLSVKGLHSYHERPPVQNARFGFITENDGSIQLFGDQGYYSVRGTSGAATLSGTLATGALSHRLAIGANVSRQWDYGSVYDGSAGVFNTNLYNPVASPRPTYLDAVEGKTGSNAVDGLFISDIVKFNSRLSALVGLRWGQISVDNFDINTGQRAPGNNELSETTPTFALMFTPVERSLLYANFAEGIEQGGVAPQGTVNETQRLSPMRTRQLEVGGKYEVGPVRLASALFELVRPSEYVDAASNRYVQRGRQNHRGFEFTAAGDLGRDVTMLAGLMLMDPTSKKTGDATTEGKNPVGVPTMTTNVWASYRLPGVRGLSVNGGVYGSSAQFLDAANTQEIPSFTRLDVGAAYDAAVRGKRMSFLFGIENLADKDYWSSAQSGLLVLSSPRTVKMTAKTEF